MTQLYDGALAATGLRSTQLAILMEIGHRTQKLTLSALASELVLDRSALGHNLRPLERDGLIEISPGEPDRRQRLVALTPRGEQVVRDALPFWQGAQKRFEAAFGKRDAAALRATLLRLAAMETLA